jgi:general secretion pathway protein B
MSYILDALKKSAKDRQRGNLPDMFAVQDIIVEKPRKRLPWPYLLIAALLLNAGLLVWWLAFSHTEKTKDDQAAKNSLSLVVTEAIQEVPGTARPSKDSSRTIGSELRPVESAPAPLLEDKPSDTSMRDQLMVKGAREVAGAQTEIPSHQPAAVSNTRVPPESRPAKPKQAEGANRPATENAGALPEVLDENKIYKLNELPPSIRQNLPAFSISALLYSSDPASRMVSVNNQMMHEGQDLTGGVTLEEITRDGVIFRHQKIRFRVDIK